MVAMEPTEETRHIPLPKGGTLELTVMPGFYERVRLHFGLPSDAPVDDDHLRMFVFGAFKTAVDKAEGEMLNGGPKVNAR
jgi:hypothetical protein